MAKNIYFVGIKGVGMTALAIYLKQLGENVSGSDSGENFVTDELLKKNEIKIFDGFNKDHISEQIDEVIVSTAYDQNNVEVAEATKNGKKIKYYSTKLGEITVDSDLIAVAGVHGKTTTTALISYIFEKAGMEPSYIIGSGEVESLKTNAAKGKSDIFIVEADEYKKSPYDNDSKFLDLMPQVAIISSIELDHPDVFNSVEEVYNAFYSFSCKVKRDGALIVCSDYPKIKKLKQSLADRNFITFGFDQADYQIVDYKTGETTEFALLYKNKKYGPYKMQLDGKYNALNAASAIICAKLYQIEDQVIKKALYQFKGVKRRLEKIAIYGDLIIYDDYAHHPSAIKNVIAALKEKYPSSKLWCVFQPHTFSRTQALLSEFGTSFNQTDFTVITKTFASAREKEGAVDSLKLVSEIRQHNPKVRLIEDWGEICEFLVKSIKTPAIIVTIGAGDIYKLSEKLKESFKILRKQF